jgi:hypothetical protein
MRRAACRLSLPDELLLEIARRLLGLDYIEAWILGRRGQGKPLQHIEFLECRDGTHLKALYERLVSGSVVRTVEWHGQIDSWAAQSAGIRGETEL